MPAYFWHQKVGGEDPWVMSLSEHRQRVLAEVKPAFVTVLDAYSAPDDTWGRDEYSKMCYSGPCYFDFDADDIADTIPKFQIFLVKLQDEGVNLKCLRLYATGGRGFHIEVPEGMFNPKAPKGGTKLLPYAYKEMALEMAVETLDLRVYTGRRGRMWRVPGIVRKNGKYKVSITLDQALAMTPELYDQVCATPNNEANFYREPPELSTYLAALFAKSQSKVDSALKSRAKAGNDEALLAKHKGDFPPTVRRLMAGVDVMPNIGFHRIAMQLAVTANALGKSREELVELCDGLVQSHESDSQRYNSPRKRKEELRRMWDYTHENECYGYSRGGIKSICAVGASTSDLDGVGEGVGVGHVPESVAEGAEEEELPQDIQDEIAASHSSLLEGMMVLKDGVFKRTADGAKMLSNLSFRSPAQMVDAEDNLLIGLEAELVSDGHNLGRQLIELPTFSSRTNLSKFCSGRSAIFSGSETQAGVVQLLLSRSAIKGDRVIYIVRKEGLDIVQNPLIRDRVERDVIWASTDGVLCTNNDVIYRFQPKVSKNPMFRTDIHLAKPIDNTEDTRAFMKALLNVNSDVIVAEMLGWFVSCFHKQFYQAAYNQFPLLHPNGPAGSGKTLTTLLLDRMFFLTNLPVMFGCSQQATTSFTLKSAWTGSASVPLILDEYKPSELGPVRTEFLMQHFRLLYNQGSGASGGINRGGADTSFRDVTNYTFSAPTAFLGESQEMQTAIVQRSLPIAFNPADSARHTRSFELASLGADLMPRLGRLLLARSLHETTESRRAVLDPIKADLRGSLDKMVHDRQVFNLSVVVAGLDFLDAALQSVFNDEFKSDMERLKMAIYDHKADISVSVMSEASKCLNDMSLMSRTEAPDSEFAMRESYEYIVGDGWIEIQLRESFVKYFSWCKRKGFPPLYSSAEAFVAAMGKSPSVTSKTCFDSKLRAGGASGLSRIFRFDLERLTAEGIEPFKSKSLA